MTKRGCIVAVRTTKAESWAWMPDDVYVVCTAVELQGFSTVAGVPEPIEALKKRLGKIARQWHAEHGKGWRLEIRPV